MQSVHMVSLYILPLSIHTRLVLVSACIHDVFQFVRMLCVMLGNWCKSTQVRLIQLGVMCWLVFGVFEFASFFAQCCLSMSLCSLYLSFIYSSVHATPFEFIYASLMGVFKCDHLSIWKRNFPKYPWLVVQIAETMWWQARLPLTWDMSSDFINSMALSMVPLLVGLFLDTLRIWYWLMSFDIVLLALACTNMAPDACDVEWGVWHSLEESLWLIYRPILGSWRCVSWRKVSAQQPSWMFRRVRDMGRCHVWTRLA